ncbi:putative component of NuA3 histone acetyltransferase complex [Mitosporidium daphniae]
MDINAAYTASNFINHFRTAFLAGKPFEDKETGAILRSFPFQFASLPNFVSDASLIDTMRHEILYAQQKKTAETDECHKVVRFFHRRNDLHDFFQSMDLKTLRENTTTCDADKNVRPADGGIANFPAIRAAVTLFTAQENPSPVMTLLESLTGQTIDLKQMAIAAQVYLPGSFLLCHDDALEGRLFAWVLYVVDEEPLFGGSLQLFGAAPIMHRLYPTVVVDCVHPCRNMLIFFAVSDRSFHAVEEIFGGTRVSLSGWFYASDKVIPSDVEAICQKEVGLQNPNEAIACVSPNIFVSELVATNRFYKSPQVCSSVMTVLRKNRVVSLHSFFEGLCVEYSGLLNSGSWQLAGPPNYRHYYECVGLSDKDSLIQSIISGYRSIDERCFSVVSSSIHHFMPGSYQVIHDDFPNGKEQSLDLLLFVPHKPSENPTTPKSLIKYASLVKRKAERHIGPKACLGICKDTTASRDKIHGKVKRGSRESVEEMIEIDPTISNTLYVICVQGNTQISVDYLKSGTSPFFMIAIRLART